VSEKRFSTGTLLRLLFTIGLTAYLVYNANPHDIGRALAGVDWRWIAAAVGLALLDRVLMGLRWLWLLAPIDRAALPPIGTIMRVFFVSTFVGTFLPSGLGGDAVRSVQLSQEGVPMAQSLASVLIDRVLGIVGILVASALGLVLYPALASDHRVGWVFLVTAAASLAALSMVYSETCANVGKRLCRLVPIKSFAHKLERLIDALLAYRNHHGAVTLVLAGSIGVQFLRVLQAWCLGLSLGMNAPFIQYVAFVPLIVLIMQVAPVINGLGASQAAFEWLFKIGGTAAAPAIALSILFVALGFVGIVPGMFLFLTGGRSKVSGTSRTSESR
jgi:uncharacterized protein (TIRG00374 family)